MSASLNAITAPDSYSTAATLAPGLELDRIIIDVSNQAIYWELLQPEGGGSGTWEADPGTYMLPGSRVIREPAAGIRVRAAIPAASLPAGVSQAVVTVRAVY